MALLMTGQVERVGSKRIDTPVVLSGVVLGLLVLLHLSNLSTHTAFYDEALYTVIGRKLLQHVPQYPAVRWITGSDLYPLIAGLASSVFDAGLYGARLVSVACSTGAALAVALLTGRLFNKTAALLALMVFGFAGVSQLVGQLATYDGLGIAALAGATALLVYGLTTADRQSQQRYLLLAAGCFALSVLSKYVALMFIPVVLMLVVLLVDYKDRPRARRILQYFLLPAGVILGAYILFYHEDLAVLVTTVQEHTWQPATRLEILQTMLQDGGIVGLLGLLGSIHLARSRHRARGTILLLCWLAALVFPTYHLLTGNIRSLDKHIAYALVFLAPLAGWGVVQTLDWIAQRVPRPGRQALATLGVILLLLGAIQVELNRGAGLVHSWPDKQATLDYLRTLAVPPGTHVLAEGSDIYTLALGWETSVDPISTWDTGFTHGGATGVAAMKAGLADHHFQ
jgi:4-amino-4-deoxy-L-arabinose transferase-like glycosyltransferase